MSTWEGKRSRASPRASGPNTSARYRWVSSAGASSSTKKWLLLYLCHCCTSGHSLPGHLYSLPSSQLGEIDYISPPVICTTHSSTENEPGKMRLPGQNQLDSPMFCDPGMGRLQQSGFTVRFWRVVWIFLHSD